MLLELAYEGMIGVSPGFSVQSPVSLSIFGFVHCLLTSLGSPFHGVWVDAFTD